MLWYRRRLTIESINTPMARSRLPKFSTKEDAYFLLQNRKRNRICRYHPFLKLCSFDCVVLLKCQIMFEFLVVDLEQNCGYAC